MERADKKKSSARIDRFSASHWALSSNLNGGKDERQQTFCLWLYIKKKVLYRINVCAH